MNKILFVFIVLCVSGCIKDNGSTSAWAKRQLGTDADSFIELLEQRKKNPRIKVSLKEYTLVNIDDGKSKLTHDAYRGTCKITWIINSDRKLESFQLEGKCAEKLFWEY